MKKLKWIIVPVLTLSMLASCAEKTSETTASESASDTTTEATETAETTTEATEETTTETTVKETTAPTESTAPTYTNIKEPYGEAPSDAVIPEGYHFVWSDEFDGEELSKDNWLVETHPKGFVNNELQKYVNTPENIYLENGDLVIQPLKEEDDKGKVTYTSGRINSYMKASFKYGYFEARIKVPEGQGFLPAFWMMPSTNAYGGWPLSGEIDIMEVVGGMENTTFGTLHYGLPHEYSQGSYTLSSGKFSSDYHIYGCEYLPDKIAFYIDGEKFYETSDWYCTTKLGVEKEFPAPFDNAFYFTLNVAVGGDWPGDPDDSTVFDERAQMRVDYVRVYQLDSLESYESAEAEDQ